MKTATLLPSIRSCVGDWNYYVTTLTFTEVDRLVKAPDEIHERKKLAEWIQREAIDTHSEAIAGYIENNKQRFLGSLIVGVYGGSPNWTPVNINITENDTISSEQIDRIQGRLGLLHLSGSEKLFAIDGQHRVAGIKLALSTKEATDPVREESISAIFVAHDASSEAGKQRTRRLFTTVNKKAKIISKAAKIALDEDDGFAIVTRMLIDKHWLFEDARKYILYNSGGSIPVSDLTSITSVVGLFEIVKDLYCGPKKFELERPSNECLKKHLDICISFFDELVKQIPEFKKVFRCTSLRPGHFRLGEKNHLLFRPIGQRAFARATQLLLSRGRKMADTISELKKAELYLNHQQWHYILWDPLSETMITTKLVMAEAQLLREAGHALRNKVSANRLDKLLASIDKA